MGDISFQHIFDVVISGGPQSVISILMVIIAGLVWDRTRLQNNLNKKDDKIEEVIDNYYKGNTSLTDALNSLKVLLSEIKSKM